MDQLDFVAISDLKVLASFANAEVGRILQVRRTDKNAISIGMRCEIAVSNGTSPAYLVLDGENRGLLLQSGFIREQAVDITDILRLGVDAPAPLPLAAEHVSLSGIICEAGAGSGKFFMRAIMPNGMRWFVWLHKGMTGYATDQAPKDSIVIGASKLEAKSQLQITR